MRPGTALIAAALLATAAVLTGGARAPTAPSPRELLRDLADLSDREWAALERGEALARILSTDSREIAIVGAVRIRADRSRLLARYRDIDNLKRTAVVLDAAPFSGLPQPSDLLRVPFEDHSLDLRNCRPGDCQVRLTAGDIERFHREVNWQDESWRERSASLWREVLATYAAAYRAGGRAALPVYANKRDPLSVGLELASLVRQYVFVSQYSPEFHAYLQDFGPTPPSSAEQVLYWTKEDFGIRPVVRISHQVTYRALPGGALLVATNQVYADHYLDSALTVTMAIDADDSPEAFYLISVNRARTRSLTGILRAMVRSMVQGRSRDATRHILTATKSALERESARRANGASHLGKDGSGR